MHRIQEPIPCPPSTVISDLVWGAETVRLGGERCGDNWPMTWGDDDLLYAALGDGYGFSRRPTNYTLAFATIRGTPPNHSARDLPSNIDTPVGWGSAGIKASGLLMVGGVLYLFVRNYVPPGRPASDWKHSRLAWSDDHGRTWTWAGWHFSDTFGCPEFVQFGPNYAGARDKYVYVVSQEGDSAYDLDPGIVLARVPKSRIPERSAYDFFAGTSAEGVPMWHRDIALRTPIFTDPKGTQRVSITYSRPLRRFFLVTAHGVPSGIPHTPALGVFDAPEPWGPWTTVYYRDDWAEEWMIHHKFPTKWMSADGLTMWLAFSGQYRDGGTNYCLLARKATLTLSR
jgi:hypothetical protein